MGGASRGHLALGDPGGDLRVVVFSSDPEEQEIRFRIKVSYFKDKDKI